MTSHLPLTVLQMEADLSSLQNHQFVAPLSLHVPPTKSVSQFHKNVTESNNVWMDQMKIKLFAVEEALENQLATVLEPVSLCLQLLLYIYFTSM